MTVKSVIAYVALFAAILIFFVLHSVWYEPARLVMSGVADTVDATIRVEWDSGAGFNPYEKVDFHFTPKKRGDDSNTLAVVIAGNDEHSQLSVRNKAVLTEIRVDGRGLHIPKSAIENVRYVRGSGWFLDSSSSKIKLDVKALERIQFSFKTSARSGIADISIDGTKSSHDLYRSNWEILFSHLNFWLLDDENKFTVSLDFPRYFIETLKIDGTGISRVTSLYLLTKKRRTELNYHTDESGNIIIDNPNGVLKRYYHPAYFPFQILFALITLWGLFFVRRQFRKYQGVWDIFLNEKRWVFWSYFAGALVVYGVAVAAFWPGVMSVDSLNIWRAALLPETMINNHPVINEIWYMFFQQIWNNIAIIPIAQVVLLSLLIAATYFFIFRQGVRWEVLIPGYLLLLFSLPVALYNVTLWKDVPFALLIVFWALSSAYFYYIKRKGESPKLTVYKILPLPFLFLSLLTFRHNGLIYLVILPLLFICLKLMRFSRKILAAGLLAAVMLLYLVIFPPSYIKGGSYFHDLSSSYLKQIKKESVSQRLVDGVKGYPRILDIRKNHKESDFWHYYLADRFAYHFLSDVGWNDVYKYIGKEVNPFPELRSFVTYLYKKSLDYPWVYVSWYPFILPYLFILSIILFRWMPLSAIYSVVILSQVFALLIIVGTHNWRYYYFFLIGGYFLIPVILLDLHCRKSHKIEST